MSSFGIKIKPVLNWVIVTGNKTLGAIHALIRIKTPGIQYPQPGRTGRGGRYPDLTKVDPDRYGPGPGRGIAGMFGTSGLSPHLKDTRVRPGFFDDRLSPPAAVITVAIGRLSTRADVVTVATGIKIDPSRRIRYLNSTT